MVTSLIHSQHPVLLTEAPLNPRSNRDIAAQIFFDTFNVPALYISVQAVLSLYVHMYFSYEPLLTYIPGIRQVAQRASSWILETVLHMLYRCSKGFQCPMLSEESILLEGATNQSQALVSQNANNRAHRDVTDHLQLLLRKAGHHLHTTAELEVVRTIKERSCYIALNPQKEEKDSASRTEDFKLPDGNTIQVGTWLSPVSSNDSHIAPHTAGSRAVPGPRNSLQPRTHRSRIRWRSSSRRGRNQPRRPRPEEELVLQHCPQWWKHALPR